MVEICSTNFVFNIAGSRYVDVLDARRQSPSRIRNFSSGLKS
jgi:hypothetical protein